MMRWLWLLIALILTACGKSEPGQVNHSIRYLALGDSYTIGESVDESARYPARLVAALRQAGFDVGDPQIIAQTGWTTGDLIDAMDRANLRGPYGLVTLLIGVNNQYQGRPEEEYHKEFVILLNRAIDLAGGKARHVIVLSIPDWGVTPYAANTRVVPSLVSAAIDRFNAINKSETDKAGAEYVDVTALSRSRSELVAGDGLHPSKEMYEKWTGLMLPAAEAMFQH